MSAAAKHEKTRGDREVWRDEYTTEPVLDQGIGNYGFTLVVASAASSWITFVGFAGLIAHYFMSTNPAQAQYSFVSVLMPGMMLSAFLGAPIWVPMSWWYFHSYSNAVIDGHIRSALGVPVVLLLCSIGILGYLALVLP